MLQLLLALPLSAWLKQPWLIYAAFAILGISLVSFFVLTVLHSAKFYSAADRDHLFSAEEKEQLESPWSSLPWRQSRLLRQLRERAEQRARGANSSDTAGSH